MPDPPSYQALAANDAERQQAYRDLFRSVLSEAMLVDIRSTIKSGMALGNERFKQEVEALTGRRQHKGMAGRPKKYRF